MFGWYAYISHTLMVVSIFQVKQKELWESLTQLLLRPSEAIQYWITASKGHTEQNTVFLLIAVSLQMQFFTVIKKAKCYSGLLDCTQDLSPAVDASNKYRHISRNAEVWRWALFFSSVRFLYRIHVVNKRKLRVLLSFKDASGFYQSI